MNLIKEIKSCYRNMTLRQLAGDLIGAIAIFAAPFMILIIFG